MGNATASALLGRHVAALRAMANGDEFITEAAAETADVIETELKRSLDSGADPYGKPWPKSKDGGKPVLVGAFAKHVRIDPIGNTVIIRLRDKHAVLHHFGNARGKTPARPMIPTSGIPVQWLPKMRGAIVRVFGRRLEVQS